MEKPPATKFPLIWSPATISAPVLAGSGLICPTGGVCHHGPYGLKAAIQIPVKMRAHGRISFHPCDLSTFVWSGSHSTGSSEPPNRVVEHLRQASAYRESVNDISTQYALFLRATFCSCLPSTQSACRPQWQTRTLTRGLIPSVAATRRGWTSVGPVIKALFWRKMRNEF